MLRIFTEGFPLQMFWWCLAILEAPSLAKETDCLHCTRVREREAAICTGEKDGADIPDLQFFEICVNLKTYPVRGYLLLLPHFSKQAHAVCRPPVPHTFLLWSPHNTDKEGAVYLVYICLHASARMKLANGLKSQKLFHEQEKSTSSLNIPFYVSFLHFWLRTSLQSTSHFNA